MNNLDLMTIDDYFREYSHFHVKKATELLKPLHTPGQDPLPDYSDATPVSHSSRRPTWSRQPSKCSTRRAVACSSRSREAAKR